MNGTLLCVDFMDVIMGVQWQIQVAQEARAPYFGEAKPIF